ncbi:hypothetical protein JM93_01557 [Roseibium hamelinense]|uniref:Uncharacterized protein n=1 Tax=Roseibium hamelinense TaxID=150831 RepID=A0A562T896_9HYPH|nr:hypothetical protein [Roseibium hamelinense]MTI43676.1 hypothetical protein [Roseibium hamelinense]TWI89354.1 hypothetical protein JM93_01557 [Roseibium hamelinense]
MAFQKLGSTQNNTANRPEPQIGQPTVSISDISAVAVNRNRRLVPPPPPRHSPPSAADMQAKKDVHANTAKVESKLNHFSKPGNQPQIVRGRFGKDDMILARTAMQALDGVFGDRLLTNGKYDERKVELAANLMFGKHVLTDKKQMNPMSFATVLSKTVANNKPLDKPGLVSPKHLNSFIDARSANQQFFKHDKNMKEAFGLFQGIATNDRPKIIDQMDRKTINLSKMQKASLKDGGMMADKNAGKLGRSKWALTPKYVKTQLEKMNSDSPNAYFKKSFSSHDNNGGFISKTTVSMKTPSSFRTAPSIANKVSKQALNNYDSKLGDQVKSMPVNYQAIEVKTTVGQNPPKTVVYNNYGANFKGKDPQSSDAKCDKILGELFPVQPRSNIPVLLESKSMDEDQFNDSLGSNSNAPKKPTKKLIDLRILMPAKSDEVEMYGEHCQNMDKAAKKRGDVKFLGVHGMGHGTSVEHAAQKITKSLGISKKTLTSNDQLTEVRKEMDESFNTMPSKIREKYQPVYDAWKELSKGLGNKKNVIPFATMTAILSDAISDHSKSGHELKFAFGCKSAKDRTTAVLQGVMMLRPVIEARLEQNGSAAVDEYGNNVNDQSKKGGVNPNCVSELFDKNGKVILNNMSPDEVQVMKDNFDLTYLQMANKRNTGIATNNADYNLYTTFEKVPFVAKTLQEAYTTGTGG